MTFSEKLDKKALSHVADRYDAYIVGNDQVWNPLITGGDSAYFLDFVKDRQKKFAYVRASVCLPGSGISVCGENARRFPGDLHP